MGNVLIADIYVLKNKSISELFWGIHTRILLCLSLSPKLFSGIIDQLFLGKIIQLESLPQKQNVLSNDITKSPK